MELQTCTPCADSAAQLPRTWQHKLETKPLFGRCGLHCFVRVYENKSKFSCMFCNRCFAITPS